MKTIENLIKDIIYDYVYLKELNQVRVDMHKTDDFIDRTIFLYARTIILNGLSLTSEIQKSDDLCIDKTKIDEKSLNILNKFKEKYKTYRNKEIAHTTSTSINVPTALNDLKETIDVLNLYKSNNGKMCNVEYISSNVITEGMKRYLNYMIENSNKPIKN